MITQLVLATHNKGKVAEISDMLAPFGITVLSAGALGLAEPAETETTFVGNALIKARAAAKASKNFAEADRIRKLLLEQGIVLKDSPTGTTWEAAQ